MNKIIPALVFIISSCALPGLSRAQENHPVSIEGNAVYTVPSASENTSPDKSNGPVSAPVNQPNTKVLTHPAVTPKTLPEQVKKNTSISNKTAGSGAPGFILDAEGNMVKVLTPEEKSKQVLEAEHFQTEMITQENIREYTTHTSFEVQATQEIIPASEYIISERPLNKTSDKKVTPTKEVPAATTTSIPRIGKVEFLKQYASDLKIQIEKNKNDPNYPLQEKQNELKGLEDLLKEE
jgi:hypothetical protein